MPEDASKFLEGRSRETQIRRDAGGRWYNGEDRIDHPNLVRSFDSWVDRAEDGRFCLRNAINWAYVEIEGAAYFVKDLTVVDDEIILRLSGGADEALDPDTLRQDGEGALWCIVREGRCPARFETHAATKLSQLIDEDDLGVYVEIGDQRVHPPMVADPLSLGTEKR
jgi:hypothetical protein